jgi:hypothetical protein
MHVSAQVLQHQNNEPSWSIRLVRGFFLHRNRSIGAFRLHCRSAQVLASSSDTCLPGVFDRGTSRLFAERGAGSDIHQIFDSSSRES